MKIQLSKTVTASARDYVDALLEACSKGGAADPVEVLLDTAAYPKVTREIDMAEFLVGWFHGVAEANEIEVGDLWAHLAGDRKPTAPAPKGKAKPAAKPARKPTTARELAPARKVKPPRAVSRAVHVTSAATAAAVKREAPEATTIVHAAPAPTPPGSISVVAIGGASASSHAAAARDALSIPAEGYGSPVVGATTGKRRRGRRVAAGQGSLLIDPGAGR